MSDFQDGNYDNCPLKEATFGEGQFGPQWVMVFEVGNAKKIVYLSCATDKTDDNGKTSLDKTVETLGKMGWNQNFDEPTFEVAACDLYAKTNSAGTQRWFISSGNYKVAPASTDQRQQFKTAFRAVNGAPKPSGARPAAATTTAPARPTAAPARPTAPAKPAPKGGAIAKNADEAWSAVIKVLPKADSVTFWNIVAQIGEENSIAEADFTPALWQKVVDAASLPDAPFA